MSPFASKKQRAFMFATMPDLAERWSKKYGSRVNKSTKKKGK